jgi:glutamate synthase domain-containing protein 2
MGRYRCEMCMQMYDEAIEGVPFAELKFCPFCNSPVSLMTYIDEGRTAEATADAVQGTSNDLQSLLRSDPDNRHMDDIHQMAADGKSIVVAMNTSLLSYGWDDVVIMGNQLNPLPLEEDQAVDLTTVIGKHAAEPLVLTAPFFISHMSFGALSYEAKLALARGAALAECATCSGEGGILPDEQAAAYQYIFEYVPNRYSVTRENLQKADAVEIKIGQGTKPGMGGLLPGAKVTEENARIRGKEAGRDIVSPAKFPHVHSREDLRELVFELRSLSGGRPIGIKIAAGRIERDLEYCLYAEADFVTLDLRGGATGASPKLVRDSTGVPGVHALNRARAYLDEAGSEVSLIVTGGLRVSSDIVKALAMGADAVALATAPLMAIGCQQYRICHSGSCPMGIATQDPELRKRLDVSLSAQRLANFLNVTKEELRTFARITGHADIHELNLDDIRTTTREISHYTSIRHV